MARDENSTPVGALTEREREILQLMSDGLSNEAIGKRLFLSTGTVKWYAKQIFSKLAVSNRTEAAKQARELGFLAIKPSFITLRDPTSRHKLLTPRSPIIGRARDITLVLDLLGRPDGHLVTLTGPGGIGKTILAIEVGNRCFDTFEDGVYFVALQPLASTGLLEFAIANTLGLLLSGGGEPREQLLEFLRTKDLLLILDNFEHLLGQVPLVKRIGDTALKVKVLVTSREPLRLREERLVTLEGLPVAPETGTSSNEVAEALQLFEDRAKRIDPRFAVVREKSSVADICQLVRGLPLAIEIAASWVSTLSCEEIATQIRQELDFLTTDLHDMPERHRSMRAVFEQSWRLLPEHEQSVLRRFAVFPSSFSKEAAAHVAKTGLPLLATFIQKSLIWRLPSGRYAVHELLRQYLEQKLSEIPDEHEVVYDRYADYYADFMAQRWPWLKDGRAKAALDAIDLELENIWVAWQRLVQKKDLLGLHKIINPLAHFYLLRRAAPEIQAYFEQALAVLASSALETTQIRACILSRLAYFSLRVGNLARAKVQVQEAIAGLERETSSEDLIIAYLVLAMVYHLLNEFQAAQAALESQRTIAHKFNNRQGVAWALMELGAIALDQGLDQDAERLGLESLAMLEAIDDQYGIAMINTVLLNWVAHARSRYAEAEERLLHALALFEALGASLAVAITVNHLGIVATSSGNYADAKFRFLQCLEFFHRLGFGRARQVIYAFINIGALLAAEAQIEPAIELLSFAVTHTTSPLTRHETQTSLNQLRMKIPEAQFTIAEQRGRSRTLEEIMTLVLGLLRH